MGDVTNLAADKRNDYNQPCEQVIRGMVFVFVFVLLLRHCFCYCCCCCYFYSIDVASWLLFFVVVVAAALVIFIAVGEIALVVVVVSWRCSFRCYCLSVIELLTDNK